jgi:hypothetical protein
MFRRSPLSDLAAAAALIALGSGCSASSAAPSGQQSAAIAADGAPAACSRPTKADTFSDASGTGCKPKAEFNLCEVPNGGSVGADGAVAGPNGAPVVGACHDACSASEYALDCLGSFPSGGGGGIPDPDPALGCRILPIPTPPAALFYCCPCAP